MYLGMLIIVSGFPLIVDSLIGFLFPVHLLLSDEPVGHPEEERVVEGVFGEAYRAYKSRTRRWI
ncbi:MAG: hypothetical protein MZV70_35990 [Desulfobacterales bacterium]|nr:hypothetical protein [Desulfobacterales bacterium]